MRQSREPLGVRIATDEKQNGKGQDDRPGIGKGDREDQRRREETKRAKEKEKPNRRDRKSARRQMPRRRARVLGVDLAIRKTIEGHCRAAGEHHAQQNADELEQMKRCNSPGERGAREGEWQRKEGVAEAYHL